MESSVVIVVGITVTLLSLLVKFHVRITELDCAVELIAIKQTRSVASPTIPCKLFDLKKILGEGTTYVCQHTYVNTRLLIDKTVNTVSIYACTYHSNPNVYNLYLGM